MISGLILAAGASRRMGKPKQILNVGGKPMLERVVDAFSDSRLDEVVLVVRPGLPRKPTAGGRVRVLVNPHPEEGVSSSVRLGVESIDSKSEAVVIGLGDKPLLRSSTIQRLLSAFRDSGSKIIIPTYDGVRGNPILFHRSLFQEMLRLKGDAGAKSVIARHAELILEIPVSDEGVSVDVNTPGDLRAVERILAARTRLAGKGKSRN
ncbi:MAG: nucleotidyltransferase family protein [Nitrososphaerales archaeon]|nr:nucleotidyltransferase family protein [Nitrososphaerales archaeon]